MEHTSYCATAATASASFTPGTSVLAAECSGGGVASARQSPASVAVGMPCRAKTSVYHAWLAATDVRSRGSTGP